MSQEAFTNRLNILFDAGLLSDFNGELLPEIEKCFGLYVIPDKNKSPALVLSETDVEQLKKAYDEFQKIKRTGITDYFSPYGEYNPIAVTCTHLLNKKAGLSWSTFTHTGTPVVTYALGKQQELFSGYYDNTNIAKVIFSILEEN
jgi:alkaline phosphatase